MFVTVGIVVLIIVLLLCKYPRPSNTFPVALLDDGSGNEALIVEGVVCGEMVLFLIDTAYAGAPVLSISYMNCLRKNKRLSSVGSLHTRFMSTMEALKREMTNQEMHETLNEYVDRGICRTFTSGCTMRLMGIGETAETQSEMLLCPPLLLSGKRKWVWDADVFVTNPLHGSTHILTSDYLLHHGPALLEPRRGQLTLRASIQKDHFDVFKAYLVGGAFVIAMEVAGVVMNIVLDTGASTTLSISRSAGKKIESGCKALHKKVYQTGVNGENVCSDVVRLSVAVGSTTLSDVDVLINAQEVEGADGYLGIGILRAFDLFLSHDCVGLKPNGLAVKSPSFAAEGRCLASVPCATK